MATSISKACVMSVQCMHMEVLASIFIWCDQAAPVRAREQIENVDLASMRALNILGRYSTGIAGVSG